jgi:hypothetical protein
MTLNFCTANKKRKDSTENFMDPKGLIDKTLIVKISSSKS